jgi:hypothetical protein
MKSLQCFKQGSGGGNGCRPGKRLERRLSLGDYKKSVSWSKYLIAPPGARIRGGGEEFWSADLSKLEIRDKFASGRHSRVYSGRYAGREVVSKMISQPAEDAALATEVSRGRSDDESEARALHGTCLRVQNSTTCPRPMLLQNRRTQQHIEKRI